MTFIISIGRYGGFYIFNGFTKRICLGWIAFTYVPMDDALPWDKASTTHP